MHDLMEAIGLLRLGEPHSPTINTLVSAVSSAIPDPTKQNYFRNQLGGGNPFGLAIFATQALLEAFDSPIRVLVRAVEAKDPFTFGHSVRVMMWSITIASEMGLSPQDVRAIGTGALIHDIGKIGVPEAILLKPGALSEEEYKVIKQHPATGDQMIAGISSLVGQRHIVRSHHEKLDGSGYPDGLVGEQIGLDARIVAVADIYDALTSDRAYRQAMTTARALEVLADEVTKGKLDPEVLKTLTDLINIGADFRGDSATAA